ncbi:MAG: helix-turn-helix domain-containing protein [Azoarcus sp.]|jgi:phage repressor protein C with HTH and peptisase S24 domain|nr:helix-turn-helix domain-containing protein [Azoarcus sp.]
MKTFTERIQFALSKANGIKQADIARACNISTASVNNWLSGATKSLRGENLLTVSDILGVSSSWLATGKGPMTPERKSRSDISRFDVLHVAAACGAGAVNSDYPEIIHSIEIVAEGARKLIGRSNADGSVKVVRAEHDSMLPTIQPDDLLFVDTSIIAFDGEGVYLLLHAGELICKRLTYAGRTLTVVSDNKNYPPWPWAEKLEETRIVGKVLRALPMEMKNFGN